VVWDLSSGKVRRTFSLPDHASGPGTLLTPDGRYVLTVQGGSFVRGDIATGRSVQVPGSQTEADALAITPDGRFYAIGRQDGTVDEYDARSLRLVRHHTLLNAIQRLAFSPDGRDLAVMDNQNLVRVWDTCDACEDASRLAELTARQTVRSLTPGERATFNLD
jgi:WD40 repeat protein